MVVKNEAGEAAGALELEPQVVFYVRMASLPPLIVQAQYHTNKINVAIHLVCIVPIFASAMGLITAASRYTSLAALNVPYLASPVDLTPGMIIAICYATYFFLLDPIAGGLYAPILLSLGHLGNRFLLERPDAVQKLGLINAGGWVLQFIGHGVFEGRAPALFDSLLQALVLAVFFVWLEALFALGYKPDLHKRIQNAVLEYRRQRKARGHQPAQKPI